MPQFGCGDMNLPTVIALEAKAFHSADVESVWEWNPDAPEEVFFQLGIEIGRVGDAEGHWFQAVVATPEGIRATFDRLGMAAIPNRNLIVLCDYRWDTLLDRLQEILNDCQSATLPQSFEKLSRYLFWEYEDFQPES